MIASLALACTDYVLRGKDEDTNVPDDTVDSGDPAVDTDDTDVEDSAADTAEDTDPETGDPWPATEPVYINDASTLYSFDPDTRTATRIGTFREGGAALDGGMTDIAISLDGVMYGGSFDALYRIDPTTAECTFVATLGDELTGLTFVSDGRLVGAGAGVSFIDVRTGALDTLVAPGAYETSGDIVGLPDGYLYWSVWGGDLLIRVDPDTGATRRVGDVGVERLFGLGYADGALYAFTGTSDVIVVDETTAAAGAATDLPVNWWGAATNPVLW